MNSCLNCALAKWETTAAGRLHPGGDGRCQWKPPAQPPIASAFYYLSGEQRPCGGHITRRKPHENCPTWEAKE